MPPGNVRLRGSHVFILLGAISLLGAALPAACNHGGGLTSPDSGATGGANGGAPVDAAATGGSGGQVSDGPPDHPIGSGGNPSSAGAGGSATGGSGGTVGGTGGGAGGRAGSTGGASGGGTAGGSPSDGGTPDLASVGGAGGVGSGGAAGGGGAPTDGGSTDVMFPCGPCSLHWVCGGYGDANETDITLTPEEGGCYLAGLSGHVLLAPDGTVTENGMTIGKAQKAGPQVTFFHPDGSSWFLCGGNLPCSQ